MKEKTKEEIYNGLKEIVGQYGIFGDDAECLSQDIVMYLFG